MKCMNCGAPLTRTDYCTKCGCDISVQIKVSRLSNLYYNRGLEKASIRDLSGAIECLQQSLKMSKYNIDARNLLGLVYFEVGEVVSALSEWVISKNMRAENNLAVDYIERLQANSNKLDAINQSVQKYNVALTYCHERHEDMAMIQLKKVLAQNPKLIKGYHLLALLQMRQKAYNKARKTLKKAIRIDKTNTTTLRFLREIDQQTGVTTSLEGRDRKTKELSNGGSMYMSDNDVVIQPPAFRESSPLATVVNLGLGLIIGAAAIWFLVVPARTQKINQEANDKITQYSEQSASKTAATEESTEENTASLTQDQLTAAEARNASYENLINAYLSLQNQDAAGAAAAMENVNADDLSEQAKGIYSQVLNQVVGPLFQNLLSNGLAAVETGDNDTAITKLTRAISLNGESYEAYNGLQQAYTNKGDTANADAIAQEIQNRFTGQQATAADNSGSVQPDAATSQTTDPTVQDVQPTDTYTDNGDYSEDTDTYDDESSDEYE